MASVLSGLLLLSFALGMVTGLGIKAPLDYSVFSAAAAAFLLAFWEPDRFTLDRLLNRLGNWAGDPITNNTNFDSVDALRNRDSEFQEGDFDLKESRLLSMMWPDAIARMVQCAVESFTVGRVRDI
jgi:hypothetical protein